MRISEMSINSIIKSYTRRMKEESNSDKKKPSGLKLDDNDIISISREGQEILYQRVQAVVISRSKHPAPPSEFQFY